MLTATLLLAACANPPSRPSIEPVTPAVVTLDDYLQQGAQAMAEGSRERARESYRSAIKAYPSAKQPWTKLSEDAFAVGDYGNAILAAQEVLLRDPNDTMASSVLAVSGLRLSASSLQKLRQQSRIAGDTRSEAETMTQVLRDVLGEDVLVPRANGANAGKRRPASKPQVPAGKAVASASPAASSANPFDKLK